MQGNSACSATPRRPLPLVSIGRKIIAAGHRSSSWQTAGNDEPCPPESLRRCSTLYNTMKNMPRRRLFLVELFAGSHSVSRCVRRRFGESFDVRVLSVDNDPVSNPTILADINAWQYKRDIDEFLKKRRDNDIVACWSSPPCTAFSRANTTGVRDIRGGSRNVKALSLIHI